MTGKLPPGLLRVLCVLLALVRSARMALPLGQTRTGAWGRSALAASAAATGRPACHGCVPVAPSLAHAHSPLEPRASEKQPRALECPVLACVPPASSARGRGPAAQRRRSVSRSFAAPVASSSERGERGALPPSRPGLEMAATGLLAAVAAGATGGQARSGAGRHIACSNAGCGGVSQRSQPGSTSRQVQRQPVRSACEPSRDHGTRRSQHPNCILSPQCRACCLLAWRRSAPLVLALLSRSPWQRAAVMAREARAGVWRPRQRQAARRASTLGRAGARAAAGRLFALRAARRHPRLWSRRRIRRRHTRDFRLAIAAAPPPPRARPVASQQGAGKAPGPGAPHPERGVRPPCLQAGVPALALRKHESPWWGGVPPAPGSARCPGTRRGGELGQSSLAAALAPLAAAAGRG